MNRMNERRAPRALLLQYYPSLIPSQERNSLTTNTSLFSQEIREMFSAQGVDILDLDSLRIRLLLTLAPEDENGGLSAYIIGKGRNNLKRPFYSRREVECKLGEEIIHQLLGKNWNSVGLLSELCSPENVSGIIMKIRYSLSLPSEVTTGISGIIPETAILDTITSPILMKGKKKRYLTRFETDFQLQQGFEEKWTDLLSKLNTLLEVPGREFSYCRTDNRHRQRALAIHGRSQLDTNNPLLNPALLLQKTPEEILNIIALEKSISKSIRRATLEALEQTRDPEMALVERYPHDEKVIESCA